MDLVSAPIISVGVVTYNHELFIDQCLQSLISQQTTYPFEILIGDDGSTDGTAAICKRWQQRFPDKITYYQRESGYSYAGEIRTATSNFLFLLSKAKGEYYAHCDGDDFWKPNKLQVQLEALVKNAWDAIYSNAIKWKEGNELGHFRPKLKTGEVQYSGNPDELLPSQFSTLLFKRKMAKHFPDWMVETFSTDTPVFLSLHKNGKVGYVDMPLSYYRLHSSGMMQYDVPKRIAFYEQRIAEFKRYVSYHPAYSEVCRYWLTWFLLKLNVLTQPNRAKQVLRGVIMLIRMRFVFNRKLIHLIRKG